MTGWGTGHNQTIWIDVDFYDEEHAALLRQYPTGPQIEALVESGVRIPVPEFLTYFLYHRVRFSPRHYSGYRALRQAIADSYGMLADLIELGDDGLYMPQEAVALPAYVTEYIGESVALSVMNRIHGVTEADWKPIQVDRRKSLDYQLASDGTRLVRVEAKGTVSANGNEKSPTVYRQKHRIMAQKGAQDGSSHQVLNYGAITVIPSDSRPLKCWLLDPISDDFSRSPRDIRLLARVGFLSGVIRLVAPRSRLATILNARLTALDALTDPYELDNVPLLEEGEGPFSEVSGRLPAPLTWAEVVRPPFFASRSYVADGGAGGFVTLLRGRASFFFVGFREELLDVAESQDFNRLTSYSAQVASIAKSVQCSLSKREFAELNIDPRRLPAFRVASGIVRFELAGLLHYSREGLVFGELAIPDTPRLPVLAAI